MIARVLRHDRWIVLAGVVAVAALAWFDLWRRARGMMDMAMPETLTMAFAHMNEARGVRMGMGAEEADPRKRHYRRVATEGGARPSPLPG